METYKIMLKVYLYAIPLAAIMGGGVSGSKF